MVRVARSTAEYDDLFHDAPAFGLHAQKKSCLYKERDREARFAYARELAALDPAKCVYLDEAGVDDTLFYPYGWSLKGTRCLAERLGHHTQRVRTGPEGAVLSKTSMIAACCLGKVLAPMIFTGTCNHIVVETWFDKVLRPVLQPGQVIILDNASFHRKTKLRALLDL